MKDSLLNRAQNAHYMLNLVKILYPLIYDDICRCILDITEDEILEVRFDVKQYKRLKEFCERHDYKPGQAIETVLFGEPQAMIPNLYAEMN